MGLPVGNAICMGMFLLCMYCSVSEAALFELNQVAVNLLNIESLSDWALSTIFVGAGYLFSYLATASIFEWTNPLHYDKTQWRALAPPVQTERSRLMWRELELGIWMMFFNVSFAVSWLWLVDPHTPYYAYFANREYTVASFLTSLAVYMFFFDAWFYWTHRALHTPWAWKYIHHIHHQFLTPTPFAQDAVHPIEGIVQGPLGHHLVTLLVPVHPVAHALFGFLTSVYAIGAHDGRMFDWNDHVKHHSHKHVNYGLYWGFWDYVCGTRYDRNRHAPAADGAYT